MADRTRPALASVRIGRLVLHGGEAGTGLADAIAAALGRELGVESGARPPETHLAQLIAGRIGRHPDIVAAKQTHAIGVARSGQVAADTGTNDEAPGRRFATADRLRP